MLQRTVLNALWMTSDLLEYFLFTKQRFLSSNFSGKLQELVLRRWSQKIFVHCGFFEENSSQKKRLVYFRLQRCPVASSKTQGFQKSHLFWLKAAVLADRVRRGTSLSFYSLFGGRDQAWNLHRSETSGIAARGLPTPFTVDDLETTYEMEFITGLLGQDEYSFDCVVDNQPQLVIVNRAGFSFVDRNKPREPIDPNSPVIPSAYSWYSFQGITKRDFDTGVLELSFTGGQVTLTTTEAVSMIRATQVVCQKLIDAALLQSGLFKRKFCR